MRKSWLLLSAGAIAIAAPAHAQDNSQNTGTPGPLQESAEVGEADIAPTDEMDEEPAIVVTAQGRAQLLQDVPISVNVVSAESMQNSGANDIRALNQLAPSLLVSSTGSEANGSARIRGIGTVGDNPGLESSVAVFIDGVYRSRSGIGLNELGEIERIEVLRGPQGTLFGRNASAGLLNIITKSPNLNEMEGYAEATYGNYDNIRLSGGLTGPIGSSGLGYRLDGVFVKRDGFYDDITNDTDANDRDRYLVRGQLLYEPTDTLEIRLIGDYSNKDEKCCAAVYIDESVAPANRNLLTTQNPIIPVLLALGTPPEAFTQDPYSRNIYISPGRTYAGETEDWGVSGQVDWDFGGATLTSITAYREYDSTQASDTDYGFVDILFRADDGNAYRREFETFTQELRLQGTVFNDRLDWLVGAYYANEDLELTENLKFGSQYGRFAACRLLVATPFAPFFNAGQTGCLSPTGRAVLSGAVPGVPSPLGPAGPLIVAGFDRLDAVRSVGANNDIYKQNSENYAFFTHNIFHVSDQLDVTLGLRYTNETKKLDAAFQNNNTLCLPQQQSLIPLLSTPLAAVAGGLISLTCQGNSTSEINGATISDERNEDEFTGTAVVSWKPSDDFLVYGSYSRGYKAGGFNLDRSALKSPLLPFAASGGPQALVGNLQFDPETVDAYEFGVKYSGRGGLFNVSIFRQEFENFQLNTFNGSVFVVQNVNGCDAALGDADRDLSAATGSCATDDIIPGVISEGIEIEGSVFPARDLRINAGLTLVDTRYRGDLVGNDSGAPLDPALRLLPGDNLSNAPETIVTASASWTPPIGNSGLSGLLYVDTRATGDYNTGSDLFPQKEQDGYVLVNARAGVRGPDDRWAIEFWAQNLFDTDYTQVAFNSPFQATTSGPATGALANTFPPSQYPAGTQIFSAYLAEPRTYGITVRTRF